MEDYVAQAMALAAMAKAKGIAGGSYTKAETDALLDGKADLVDGKVPASQLPSYVDDVAEYASTSAFPAAGESGKIYIATDTNKTYRWGGTGYVEISESLALGETASTAYPGNKGKANADAIAKKPGEITAGKQYTIDGQTVTAGTGAEAFNDLATNKASGSYSHAEGRWATASGANSHAEGQGTYAGSNCAHAEGQGTYASGNQSHAEGAGTKASSDNSHAEGNSTKASGDNSHAEGAGTNAYEQASHAEGMGTNAYGQASHAEGMSTDASGQASHVEGYNTIASSAHQHVQGKYNVRDANGTYAFIIGNGTGDNARHNAFAIDWNGLIYVNGAATGVDVSQLTPVTVDQTYNEQSANAQSGTAVAQAVAAGKMTKIFSETFQYQWLAGGTDIGKNFTQKITAKDNTLYLALIYASEGTNGIMGSIFMTKGLLGRSSILSGSTAIQYFDNPNIITGLANVMIYSGTNTALYLYMPAMSATQSQTTGKLEIYEIGL